jgi:sugar lactone lactonase YvrE
MKTSDCPVRLGPRVSLSVLIPSIALAVSLTQVAGIAQGDPPVFPALIQLPAGFGSEGIAIGRGPTFYVGSTTPPNLGQILIGDLRTGTFSELVPPTGREAAGMKVDARTNFLFVASGMSGGGTVYDASSGTEVAFYPFLPPDGLNIVNDVVLTQDAAYFTVSSGPFLGRVALDPGGQPGTAEVIPLPANFGLRGNCTRGPGPPKANGIAATADGKHLIVVHTTEGRLYLLDTATLIPIPIDVTGGDFFGGNPLCAGDGLLLDGTTLYVAQAGPLFNRVAVVELSPDHLSGVITRYITEPFASIPAVKVPTTVAEFGSSLYAVTSGFLPPTPDFVVRLPK